MTEIWWTCLMCID